MSFIRQQNETITRRLFVNTMLTMLAAELSGAVTALIDGALTGRFLGPTALAAFGVGTPYFSIASIVSGILMVGCTSMCTRAVGKGDKAELDRVFSLTVLLGAVSSVLLAVLGCSLSGPLATLFGAGAADSALYSDTSAYLSGVFIGAPGFIMFVILTPLLQLDGDSLRPKLASMVMAVVDVGGDLLNVTVFHGGMFGMGLASSVSHYAALLVMLTHFMGKKGLFSFSFKALGFGAAPKLLRDGLPRAACMLCRGLLPILINHLAVTLAGDAGVAAYSTVTSTSFVVGALGWGIGGAVLIMGGVAFGEQDVRGLTAAARTALSEIVLFVVPLAAAVFAAAPLVSRLFIPAGEAAYPMSVTAIRCYAAALPFIAFNVASANHFQAISRLKAAYAVNVGIELVCTALCALVLKGFLGILGIWLAFPIGQALLSLAVLAAAVIKRDRQRSGLTAFLMLPADFGVREEDCIERSVGSFSEVVALSEDVRGLCASHGLDARTANRLALCTEEMAGNVIEHGFADGKPHELELRVIVKDGQAVLRMRDDCAFFDLREQARKWEFDPEHPERNMGIRMVMHAAKDVEYTRMMKTNNLIITLGETRDND